MRESALIQRDDQRKHLQTIERGQVNWHHDQTARTKTNTKNSTKHSEQKEVTDIQKIKLIFVLHVPYF